ncbi:MAG: hypothetical protein ACK4NR_06800 [Micavibrio sp.]
MIGRAYKVAREVYDLQSILLKFPEYRGHHLYLIEANSGGYYKDSLHILTPNKMNVGNTILINEQTELLSLRPHTSAPTLTGVKVMVYRPETSLSQTFKITASVPPTTPVEQFRDIAIPRSQYYCYDAERPAYNGYSPILARIYTDSIHFKGMEIPANELLPLPARVGDPRPCYFHDTTSAAYAQRLKRAFRPG